MKLKRDEFIYFMTRKRYANFEEKLTYGLKKKLEKFDRLSPGHLKVSKLGL